MSVGGHPHTQAISTSPSAGLIDCVIVSYTWLSFCVSASHQDGLYGRCATLAKAPCMGHMARQTADAAKHKVRDTPQTCPHRCSIGNLFRLLGGIHSIL